MPNRARPNIVFAFADQLQAFALGCMGNRDVRTPFLDRFAAENTLVRNTYACAPVCTPYRATLMTGRYGCQTGCLDNQHGPQPDERFLAHALHDAGYRTSYVGKFHLGGNGNKPVPKDKRCGFTEFLGYQCYNSFVRDNWFFDENDRKHEHQGHRTDITTDLAIERLDRLAERDEPFALFVSYQNPHYPEEPLEEDLALYRDQPITVRPNFVEGIEPYTPTFSPFWRDRPDEDPANLRYGGSMIRYIQHYYAMVTQLDREVARLYQQLEALGLDDNTVFVFTADHGDVQGSHGQRNKGSFIEESARVPLIVRTPDGPRGQVLDTPVQSVDWMPTLLDFAGADPEPSVEGESFAPALRGEPWTRRQPVMIEDLLDNRLCVRDGTCKLVIDRFEQQPVALFDLASDPYELHNRVEDPAVSDRRDALAQRLRDRYADLLARAHPDRPRSEFAARGSEPICPDVPWTDRARVMQRVMG